MTIRNTSFYHGVSRIGTDWKIKYRHIKDDEKDNFIFFIE